MDEVLIGSETNVRSVGVDEAMLLDVLCSASRFSRRSWEKRVMDKVTWTVPTEKSAETAAERGDTAEEWCMKAYDKNGGHISMTKAAESIISDETGKESEYRSCLKRRRLNHRKK